MTPPSASEIPGAGHREGHPAGQGLGALQGAPGQEAGVGQALLAGESHSWLSGEGSETKEAVHFRGLKAPKASRLQVQGNC